MLAYSTSTDGTVFVSDEVKESGEWFPGAFLMNDRDEDHCFVCGRHTSHFAEHDDLVEAGLARYEGGTTYWV